MNNQNPELARILAGRMTNDPGPKPRAAPTRPVPLLDPDDPSKPLPSPDGLRHHSVLVNGVHTYRLACAEDPARPRWVLFWTTPAGTVEHQEFPSQDIARHFAKTARCSRTWSVPDQ